MSRALPQGANQSSGVSFLLPHGGVQCHTSRGRLRPRIDAVPAISSMVSSIDSHQFFFVIINFVSYVIPAFDMLPS